MGGDYLGYDPYTGEYFYDEYADQNETFDNYNFDYYDDVYSAGLSPELMNIYYSIFDAKFH